MLEPFESQGYWWFPEEPENKIAGTLSCTPSNGLVLHLYLIPEKLKLLRDGLGDHFSLILGEANGERITLLNCYLFNTDFASQLNLSWTYSFAVSQAFLGWHFENEASILFDKIRVQYQHLEEWLRHSKTTPLDDLVKNKEPQGLYLVDTFNHEDLEISFSHVVSMNVSNPSFHEYILTRVGQINITSTKLKSLETIQELLDSLLIFLSLGMTKATFVIELKVHSHNLPREISVLTHVNPQITSNNLRVPNYRMLFCYQTLSDDFALYMQNWFSFSKKYEFTVELYYATVSAPSLFVETTFFNLVSALEGYHKRKYGESFIVKKNPRQRIKFRERFAHLLEHHKTIVWSVVQNKPIQELVNEITGIRDYFAHADGFDHETIDLNALTKDTAYLYQLSLLIRYILEAQFLAEIGFKEEKIKNCIKNVIDPYRN